MTLDPVHFDGIAQLAGRISQRVDAADHETFADTVFEEFLDPLWHDGRRVLGGERRRLQSGVFDVDPPPWLEEARMASKNRTTTRRNQSATAGD